MTTSFKFHFITLNNFKNVYIQSLLMNDTLDQCTYYFAARGKRSVEKNNDIIIISNLQKIVMKSNLNIVHKYRAIILFRSIFMVSPTIIQSSAVTFALRSNTS